MSVLSRPYFHDEAAAFEHLENVLWAGEAVCPHCGTVGRATKLQGKATRLGVWKCNECRKQFTVKVGTVFEHGRMPLHKMLQAVHLMCSSKKGISSHQLMRVLEVSYKTAWFLSHRIREAMRDGSLAPFGSAGGAVESDETFIGRKEGVPKRRGYAHKRPVLSLLDRDTKQVRSFHVDGTSAADVVPILKENIAKEAKVMTDEAGQYAHIGKHFASHEFVVHSADEYARGDVHTNNLEGFYSIFKRGMKGVYQHCAKKHLHRYAAEFEFRYNHRIGNGCDDATRAARALAGVKGKRLTYRQPSWPLYTI
jgi:transposase-like protein